MEEHTAVATSQPPLLQQLRNSDHQTDPQRPMAVTFKKATRTQAKARLALAGPSGSGKTYTALLLAKELGTRIAVIDTERGSSSKYGGEEGMPEFDVVELDSFSPDRYIEAIRAAEEAGYDVLIIDSLSHAWVGREGVLEQVDIARARSKTGNPFTDGWRYASPMHNRLVDTMLQSKLDLIVTMRSKTKYVLEEHNGRQIPKQVGMELVQRDGIEYEWDIVGELDKENTLVITKSRCKALSGKSFAQPGAELGQAIKAWLRGGKPPVEQDDRPRPTLRDLFALVKATGFGEAELREQQMQRWGIRKFKDLSHEQIEILYEFFNSVQQVREHTTPGSTAEAALEIPPPQAPAEAPAEAPAPERKRARTVA
jgi:DNA polymerase III delta prime subunit